MTTRVNFHAMIGSATYADIGRNTGSGQEFLGQWPKSDDDCYVIGARHDGGRWTEYWLTRAEIEALPPVVRGWLEGLIEGPLEHQRRSDPAFRRGDIYWGFTGSSERLWREHQVLVQVNGQ